MAATAAPREAVPREIVAVHEAGHAVLAVRSGWPVRYVTLASRTPGSVAHVTFPDYEVDVDTWDEMAVSAGGPIAHDLRTGCRDRPPIVRGATDDLADFTLLREAARFHRAAVLAGAPPEHGLARRATVQQIAAAAWTDAAHRVAADYGAVLAVAEALLQSPRALTGPQIRALIDATPTVALPPQTVQQAARFWPAWFTTPGWWTSETDQVHATARTAGPHRTPPTGRRPDPPAERVRDDDSRGAAARVAP